MNTLKSELKKKKANKNKMLPVDPGLSKMKTHFFVCFFFPFFFLFYFYHFFSFLSFLFLINYYYFFFSFLLFGLFSSALFQGLVGEGVSRMHKKTRLPGQMPTV